MGYPGVVTYEDFMKVVLEAFPNACITEDESGELVIATGFKMDGENVKEV